MMIRILLAALLALTTTNAFAQALTAPLPAGSNIIGAVTTPPIAAGTSTALEASHVFKASSGTVYSVSVTTTSASGWLMLFGAAAAPADGAVTPIGCWPVNANAFLSVSWPTPLALAAGITAVFSTTGPFTKTGSATAFLTAQVQ
jgi:hypothetical protein